tara:strand:- start:234 stop:764 length:531 start_codon:yes stop_codon:yes gene_type:complete
MLKKFKELFAERFFYIILAAMGAFMFYDYIVYEINKNVNSRDDDYIVNLENGDRLNIKESNTKCTKESSSFHLINTRNYGNVREIISSPNFVERFYKCRANGVRTDLVGYQRAFSLTSEKCRKNSREIPCLAGEYFNMIDENYFFRGKEENYCYRADGSIKESVKYTERCYLRKFN